MYRTRFCKNTLGLALLLAGSAASAQQCISPPPGRIFWLAADGDLDDRARFHNGVADGTVPFVPGKVGEAVNFDTDADAVFTDVTPDEQKALENTFTWELWARPTDTTPDCAEAQEGNCSGVAQRFAIFPGHGDFADEAGVGLVIGTNAICVSEHASFHVPCLLRYDTTLTDWTHIAVVMEDRTPRLYVNGVLVRTGVQSARTHAYASWDTIGSGRGLGHFRGDLDEVSLYDRALTETEIQGIFAAGSAGKCKPDCSIEHHDDLFEHAAVTANSGILSTNPDGLFGAINVLPEVDSLLFQDNMPDGFTHSIEWRTAAPVTLERFALSAFAGQPPNFKRAFRDFKLFARDLVGGPFVPVYASSVRTPYPVDAGEYRLHRCVNLRPVLAQDFRAEFVQHGEGGFFGPRVMELDGLGPDLIFAYGFEPAAE
ncbi:MAG: LamG domain-containing protein [Dokdonella sp.]